MRQVVCAACGQWTPAPTCTWCGADTAVAVPLEAADDVGLAAPTRPGLGRGRGYSAVRGLLRLDPREQAVLLGRSARWILLGALVGVLAGLSSAAFLESLRWATETRVEHPNLLFALPLVGLASGLAYHYAGGRAGGGNSLIIEEIHAPTAWVPRRMAPMTFVFTVLAHLFGASVGREGTAIQMSGSLTDAVSRGLRLGTADRRQLLIAAIAGGFGAVFGVPLAGAVFALEVQAAGRTRYDAIVPALAASVVGDLVVRALDVAHLPVPTLPEVDVTGLLVAKVALAGVAFGATALVFAELTHGLKQVMAMAVHWAPLRPLLGGIALLALTGLVGSREHLGLSLPLITGALAGGAGIAAGAFLLKLLFTAVSLGSGFQGGEVTPLFVIGSTLGVTLARLLDVPVPLLAAVGFVAVFAGATNTPIACTIMAMELFGAGIAVPAATACVLSYVVSAERGIYGSQRLALASSPDAPSIAHVSRLRPYWLPRRAR